MTEQVAWDNVLSGRASGRETYVTYGATAFLRPFIEKSFFGGRFVRREGALTVGRMLFETGALLGGAFRDRINLILVPFAGLSDGTDGVDFVLGVGSSFGRVEAVAKHTLDLLVMHEQRIEKPRNPTAASALWWMESARKRVDVKAALMRAFFYGVGGLGFCAQYPGRWEQLDEAFHQMMDPADWRGLYKAGFLARPEPEPFVPVPIRQEQAMQGFAAFCKDYWPEYLRPLGMAEA